MKQILLLILVIFRCINVYCQTGPDVHYRICNECNENGLDNINSLQTFTYGTENMYPYIKVADDYGPRQNGSNLYDWHGGIDYNSGDNNTDMGDLALAIRGGTIKGSLGTGYKRLVIQSGGVENYGYGHFFTNDNNNLPLRSGGCWLVLDDLDNRCIVMCIDGDTIAIAAQVGTVTFDGKTFTVSNTIAAGAPIGPTGYSALSTGAHLHLWVNPDGSSSTHDTIAKNPLQYVHYEAPGQTVNLRRVTHYDNNTTVPWDSTGIVYPGNNATHVVVRSTMLNQNANAKRYNRINDINQVDLILVNKKLNTAELIYGKENFSWIWVGGLMGEEMYLTNMYKDNGQENGGPKHIGNLNRQGIRPFAYATYGAHPYDDYYFPDIYTRIHKENNFGDLRTAELPLNTRYPDGEYELFARVTNIRNQVTNSDTLSFTLDNFKPYVSRVTVSQGNNAPFYDADWYGSSVEDLNGEGKIQFKRAGSMVYSSQPYPLKIDIYTSESMETLTMDSIVGIPNWAFYNPIKTVNNARDHWTIQTIDPITLSTGDDGHYTLRIQGNDYSGNSLLNMEKYAGLPKKNVKKKLPLRQKEGQGISVWTPEPTYFGIDSLHEFYYLPCPSGLVNHDGHSENRDQNCIRPEDIAEEVGQPSGQSEGWAIVHISPALEEWSIVWIDEEGNTISTDTIISGLSPGVYCYEVSDTNCCTIWACVEIEDCSSIQIDAEISPSCSTMNLGAIALTVTDGKPPYTFRWNDGSLEEDRTGLSGGIYQVTIEDDRGCTAAREYFVDGNIPVCVEVVKHEPVCGDLNQWGSFTVNMYTPGAYNYYWEKNGSPYSVSKDLIGIGYGEYCLIIRNDSSGQTVYTNCFEIHDSHPHIEAVITPEIPSNAFNGTIDLTLSNGQLPYWTHWTGPGVTGENEFDEDLNGLPNGTYCVTVVDGAGCQEEDCMTVLQYDLCQIADDYQIRKPCPAQNTGKIKAICIPLNENEVFTYQWSDGQNDLGAEVSIDDLSPGTYYLTITSSLFACIEITSFILEEAIPLVTDVSVVNTCPNNPNGSASFTIMQGEGPIMVTWPDGNKSNPRNGLDVGTYPVTIMDKHGCPEEREVVIGHSVEYDVHYTAGCLQGDIAITVTADEPPAVSWGINPVPISVPYSGLVEDGTYLLNIVMPSCTLSESFTYENFTMDGSYEISYPCEDNSGGQISTVVSSNSPGNFTYLWSTGATGSDLSPLALGTYCVTASNVSIPHCTWTTCVPVDQYFEVTIDVSASVVDPPCAPASNGSILPAVTSNSTGLLFQWDSGETIKNIYNKPAGTYCLTVYDVTGTCMVTECFTLVNKKQFDVFLNEINHTYGCGFGAPSGSIDLTSYNYKPGTLITYQWSSGETTEDILNKPAGIYSVTVSNGEGCEIVKQFEIRCCWLNDAEMNAPYFNIDGFNISSLTGPNTSDGALGVQVSTDPPNQNSLLTFIWRDELGNNVGNTPVIQNLPDGKYCVEVSNGCGNTITQCRYIKYCEGYDMESNGVIIDPCFYNDGEGFTYTNNGSIQINPTNGFGGIQSNWFSWVNNPTWCSEPNFENPEHVNSYEYVLQANVTVGAPCNKSLILIDQAGCRDTFEFQYKNGATPWANPQACLAGLWCNGSPIGQQISGGYTIENIQVDTNLVGQPLSCYGTKYCNYDSNHDFGEIVYGVLQWGEIEQDQISDDKCYVNLTCTIEQSDYHMGFYSYPYDCCELDEVDSGFHVNSDLDISNNIVIDEETSLDSLCTARLYCAWNGDEIYYVFQPFPASYDTCIGVYGECEVYFSCPWDLYGYPFIESYWVPIVLSDATLCDGYPRCIDIRNESRDNEVPSSKDPLQLHPTIIERGQNLFLVNNSGFKINVWLINCLGQIRYSGTIESSLKKLLTTC